MNMEKIDQKPPSWMIDRGWKRLTAEGKMIKKSFLGNSLTGSVKTAW